jgi:hypothetical protein
MIEYGGCVSPPKPMLVEGFRPQPYWKLRALQISISSIIIT